MDFINLMHVEIYKEKHDIYDNVPAHMEKLRLIQIVLSECPEEGFSPHRRSYSRHC